MGKVKDWLIAKKIKGLLKKTRKGIEGKNEITVEDKIKMIEALKHTTELYDIQNNKGEVIEKEDIEELTTEEQLELFKTTMKMMEKDL